jgi:hypothetical protein
LINGDGSVHIGHVSLDELYNVSSPLKILGRVSRAPSKVGKIINVSIFLGLQGPNKSASAMDSMDSTHLKLTWNPINNKNAELIHFGGAS